MTKIRTLLELTDAMDAEFAWRKKELHSIKSAVIDNENSTQRDTFIRSGVAMLYAHWEGFVKNIGTSYLQFVAHQKLKNNQLSPAMLCLSAGSVIDEAIASGKASARAKVVAFFSQELGDRCRIPYQRVVNTRSNLSSKVLREIVGAMGLDYRVFETKEKLLDEKLLHNRNHIAHGNYLTITVAEHSHLHRAILDMMQEFFDQVYTSAQTGAFKVVY